MVEVDMRRATPADSEFAYQARKGAFRAYVEMTTGWDEAEQRQVHGRRFAEHEFRVIQVFGADVGILALGREPNCVKVNQLFILPEYQGRRIGELCMQRVIDDAVGKGLPIRLRVLKVNPRALAFFRRLGFESEGESETHVFMEKPIVTKGSSATDCLVGRQTARHLRHGAAVRQEHS